MGARGIEQIQVIVDPGTGFGKNLEYNLAILRYIAAIKDHGCPVLIDNWRKSFVSASYLASRWTKATAHYLCVGVAHQQGCWHAPAA